jgi:hypothetical protein
MASRQCLEGEETLEGKFSVIRILHPIACMSGYNNTLQDLGLNCRILASDDGGAQLFGDRNMMVIASCLGRPLPSDCLLLN